MVTEFGDMHLSELTAFAVAERLAQGTLAAMTEAAEALTLAAHGLLVAYSRKVFIPLTHLCREVCHYCTFAKAPRNVTQAFLTREQVIAITRAAGGVNGQEFGVGEMGRLAPALGRPIRQRSTLYRPISTDWSALKGEMAMA